MAHRPRVLVLGTTAQHYYVMLGLALSGRYDVHALRSTPGLKLACSRLPLTLHDRRIDVELLDDARRLGMDLVFPVTVPEIRLCARAPHGVHVPPLPAQGVVDLCSDKALFHDFLGARGFDTLPAVVVDEHGCDLEGLRYPVVARRFTEECAFRAFVVRDADGWSALLRPRSRWLVQPFLPGLDVDVSFLAQDGRLLAVAVQQNLGRAGKALSRSLSWLGHFRDAMLFFPDALLLSVAERLAGELRYTGVGHVDCRYVPQTQRVVVLELNPRYWDSVLYAALAGVNFPDQQAQHGLYGIRRGPEQVAEPVLCVTERGLAGWPRRSLSALLVRPTRRRSALALYWRDPMPMLEARGSALMMSGAHA